MGTLRLSCAVVRPQARGGAPRRRCWGCEHRRARRSARGVTPSGKKRRQGRPVCHFDKHCWGVTLSRLARTIIVGDVHGCVGELGRLLETLAPVAGDRVFFVGDLVARGPDSAGVLALYRQVQGRSVLGNHEWRLLEARRARLAGEKRQRLSTPDHALLRQLGEEDWALLAGLPLLLALPEHDLCIVHAGIAPQLALASQDAWTLTHVRSIDPEGRASDRHDLEPWATRYRQGPHIVFGHNSRLGLQLLPLATGLDTGCVYGGQLSALVLSADERVPSDAELRRQLVRAVPAARCYYAGRAL